jgi:hypothetical protein
MKRDRGHAGSSVGVSLLVAITLSMGPQIAAPGAQDLSSGTDQIGLNIVENSPSASSESTIVEIPAPITLRAPTEGKIGIRLRLSVFFSWNDVRFVDLEDGDIAASLRTLTVVPGIEFMVPVGDHWMIRPYGQFGGLNALDRPGHRWMASLGGRVAGRWSFDRWMLMAGGRIDYSAVFDGDWDRTDSVSFVDVGSDFSFPLWFDVHGERPSGGVFVMTRAYLDTADLVGQDGFDLRVDAHVELGASFQIAREPKIWFVKLPNWYGLGVRFAEGHRSLRIYLGFPF